MLKRWAAGCAIAVLGEMVALVLSRSLNISSLAEEDTVAQLAFDMRCPLPFTLAEESGDVDDLAV